MRDKHDARNTRVLRALYRACQEYDSDMAALRREMDALSVARTRMLDMASDGAWDQIGDLPGLNRADVESLMDEPLGEERWHALWDEFTRQ